MNYIISEEALLDLENIWIYTFKKWSKKQADRYFNLLIDEFEFISLNPNSGKDYGKIREDYFRSLVNPILFSTVSMLSPNKSKSSEFYIKEWMLTRG